MVHTDVFLFTPIKLKVLNAIFDVVLSRKIISFIIILKNILVVSNFSQYRRKKTLVHFSLLEAAPNC